jgi:hypothetical protein
MISLQMIFWHGLVGAALAANPAEFVSVRGQDRSYSNIYSGD